MESPLFTKNQIIFARIRGYPCWPGRIHDFSTTSKQIRYIVYLYGFDRLMKFSSAQLHDYGDYIRKNTNKICDLLLYVQAIEKAQEDFRLSQNQSLREETPTTNATKKLEIKDEEVSVVGNGKSYRPLLRSLVEKKQIAEDPANLNSQQSYDGDLAELHAELNLLGYDFRLKSYASVKKVNLKKCLGYLCKLQKLQFSRFVLNRNPQVLQTLELLRRYTGDSKKWKLSNEDRKNFVHYAEKVRKHASIILKSFKEILGNQSECCPRNILATATANENTKNICTL